VDLTVAEGTIFSLLGPNGAGNLDGAHPVDPELGRRGGHPGRRARSGNESDAARAVIGVTGQFSAADDLLTGAENLRLRAALRHPAATRGADG